MPPRVRALSPRFFSNRFRTVRRRFRSLHGADLSAREHVIADRYLFQAAGFDRSFVHALEPSADQDDAGAAG